MKTIFLQILLISAAVAPALAQGANQPRQDAAPRPLYSDSTPIISLEELREVSIPNTSIDSVTIDPTDGACRVTATVTHPPANDRVKVFIALPMTGWNGRFRGNGGGGFLGGNPNSLRGPVMQGYATGATDTGHEGSNARFALDPNGRLKWQEIRDNAYLGIHAMTVVGKALTQAFYGKPPRYSYFVGNSTGGRQGLMEAQRYPEDYDGILSGCPAINWHRFLAAALWPQVVMREAKNFVSKAKLDAATAAAVTACDGLDGVVDGVIDDPTRCVYDPDALIGSAIGDDTFTKADAEIVRQIWDGPRGHDGRFMWYGLTRGTDLNTYAGTTGSPLTGKPFGIPLDWFRYFLVQDPEWDWTTMTRAEFELLWNQSVEQYGAVFGTDNPDLTRFRNRGGKIIISHGLADQQIPSQGTIEYYQRVQRQMGGAQPTAEFARLFLMPGLNHGFRGAAPAPTPTGLMNAIIRWVEEGQAPDRIIGELRDGSGKVTRTRPFMPYHTERHGATSALLIVPPSESPYPASKVIGGISIDWSTHRRGAIGSDNFMMTWSDDDHQYGVWGDGGGFGGDNKKHRVLFGVARIEGPHDAFRAYNRFGHPANSEHAANITGKCWGMVSVGRILYAWVHPDPPGSTGGKWPSIFREARLHRSQDHGASWQPSGWAFKSEDGLVGGNILQFGRDYSGARDGYVYHYMLEAKQPDASNGQLQTPGQIILLRAPKDQLMERDAYEVYAGKSGESPRWSKRLSERRHIFEDTSGIGSAIGISYHPGLKRYLLCAEHAERSSGNFGIFEAPEPWGPWSTVVYQTKSKGSWFGQNNTGVHDVPATGFFWHFPTKWMNESARELSLNFTGAGGGKNNDSFNTVRVQLLPAP